MTPRRPDTAELVRRLRLAQSAVIVCTHALMRQNADDDAHIADVLTRFVSDALDILIDEIGSGVDRPRR